MRKRLAEWRKLLTGQTEAGRELFRQGLVGPIRFTPDATGPSYRFEGEVAIGRLFTGIAGIAPFIASPTGFSLVGRQPHLCPDTYLEGRAA